MGHWLVRDPFIYSAFRAAVNPSSVFLTCTYHHSDQDWFRGKEMALAMGLNLAISRIGSVVNNVVSPAIANSTNVPFSLFFGAIICGELKLG